MPMHEVVCSYVLAHEPHSLPLLRRVHRHRAPERRLQPVQVVGVDEDRLGSSAAAPANSLKTSTPRLSIRLATYSLAARFIPSRNGVTTITSAARLSAMTHHGLRRP